jgi:alpha-beta hydrolase superfamily lysophospholipase
MASIEAVDGSCETRDGLALHYRAWLPPAPRGVLLFVHGLAEHSGRYAHVGSRFAGAGYAAYALDHRGHGRSPGRRVHLRRFAEYLDDVDALAAVARERHPGLPLVLVGHSQGGLVVLTCALERPRGLAGAIVSSPLLGVHPATEASPALIASARVLSVLWPSVLLPNQVDASRLAQDPAVGRAYLADPLVSHRVSARWLTVVLGAIERVHQRAPSLSLPVLLMISGADRVVDPEASIRFASRAPAHLVEVVRWPGFYHEMFNEADRETVFRRMEGWLEARAL